MTKIRKSYVLVAEVDWERDEIGLVLQGLNYDNFPREDYLAFQGESLAHDIVEHVNGIGRIGTVEDEFQALGGLWYVRGQFGQLRASDTKPPEEILADFMLDLYDYDEQTFTRQRAHMKTVFDESFELICEKARSYFGPPRDSEFDRFLWHALQGMRRGATALMRRYPNPARLNGVFWSIAEAVDNVFKDGLYEGMRFRLYQNHLGYWDTHEITPIGR